MTRKKQRVFQHIMEDESYQIIKKYIPKEWVIREFNRPDYGIDLVIELFDKIDDNISETLGEFVFVQVKSMKKIEITKERIFSVKNVAKNKWKEDKSDYFDMRVVKFSLDTNSIFTIQTLGASVSVLLFLVDIETESVYFVCINDYIDKIILPKKSMYTEQDSYKLVIPKYNNLKNSDLSSNALKFYGKRAKLISAFSKFYYQKNELINLFDNDFLISPKEIIEQVLFFLEQIEELDIWRFKEIYALTSAKKDIDNLKNYLLYSEIDFNKLQFQVDSVWSKLTNLNSLYEEVYREWFLPKMISCLTIYLDTLKNER